MFKIHNIPDGLLPNDTRDPRLYSDPLHQREKFGSSGVSADGTFTSTSVPHIILERKLEHNSHSNALS